MSELILDQYTELPTGKKHISFSELRDWKDCSYRHKLKYVKKIDLGKPGVMLDFGTATHAAAENFLKTKILDISITTNMLKAMWSEKENVEGYTQKSLLEFIAQAEAILTELPSWFDQTFPNWEYVDAEHYLYEKVLDHPQAFKGYIDGIIICDGKKGKRVTWLLDWKTTSWGWTVEKKSDEMVKAQLILYKNYYSIKTNAVPSQIKCGFVLLKRTAKNGSRCELVPVSVGDVTTKRALKVVTNMLVSVKKGIAVKNRSSCQYCDFKDTEFCT